MVGGSLLGIIGVGPSAKGQAEADRCEQAKERLFAATTPEEVEVARQVMDIMCND